MRISIIIPTRERARYLQHSLATVLAIDDDMIEVIVSDNASTDETKAVVKGFADSRLRYLHTGQRMSMRMNFEYAFTHATGDYIISFGDDDGILPGQFPILRKLLEDRRPDAASWSLPVYGWPVEGYGTKVGGIRFTASECFGKPVRLKQSYAREILESGRLQDFGVLPRIYHGAMSRAFLDRIKRSDGTLFCARSPDIYASFRAVLVGGEFDYFPHPFSINGHSPASTGGSMNAVGEKRQGGPSDIRFLSEIASDPIDDIIPITMSMALAYLGTAQTAAATEPTAAFDPALSNWYAAALRDMGRKGPDVAAQIDASLNAHALQFGSQEALDKARSGRGIDWSNLRTKLQKSFGKLRRSTSFRLLADENGANTIHTAANMCDAILGQDALSANLGSMTSAAAWQLAIARSIGYKRQI